jgi:hypothetical protein
MAALIGVNWKIVPAGGASENTTGAELPAGIALPKEVAAASIDRDDSSFRRARLGMAVRGTETDTASVMGPESVVEITRVPTAFGVDS